MEEEDEDVYAPDEGMQGDSAPNVSNEAVQASLSNIKAEKLGDDLEESKEEGEELEEEESDSDIDIITERKDGSKPEPPPQQSRLGAAKSGPIRVPSADGSLRPQPLAPSKSEPTARAIPQRPGSSYPGLHSSKIDLDAKPVYEPNGKPITEIDMDVDFPEDDKPWRRPGQDITDYFNYGFDEFTWAGYCLKQDSARKEVADQKKQMEELQNFLSMPGAGMTAIPGMPGASATQSGIGPMGGPTEMPPEMQQMMAQMMQSGIDPAQMDPAMFMQMMQGGQGGHSVQNQGFGGGQGYSQQGQSQQQMSYGFNTGGSSGAGGGGSGGRNQGGRGQNRNRNW